MKKENGITLTTLIIYVIGMVIVVTTVSTLTTYFYKNIDINSTNNDTTQYTKFTSVFLDEINKGQNEVIEAKTISESDKKVSYIIFSDGNQYTFKEENKSIYKNQVKICENIDNCEFSYKYQDSQYIVQVQLKTGKIDKTGNNAISYTMKN